MKPSVTRQADILFAGLGALAIIAFQVAGKATRDALFLSNFSVTNLPYMLMGSAIVSIGFVVLVARLVSQRAPARIVPHLFLGSVLMLLIEWQLVESYTRAVAILLYLHVGALGASLISSFWSLVNERFDPRTAKKGVAKIAAGGTLGGLLGGLVAERVGTGLDLTSMFPVLVAFHVLAAVLLRQLTRSDPVDSSPIALEGQSSDLLAGLKILKRTDYLSRLGGLVLLTTLSSTFLDYAFKATAAETYQNGEDLVGFFAIYYTLVGLLTFAVQVSLTQPALNGLGLGKTVALLPSIVIVLSAAALIFPGLRGIFLARGAVSIVTSSFFRSGFELFFTPVSPVQKRSTKTFIDVGLDRLGDVLGAGMIKVILILVPVTAVYSSSILLAVGFSLLALLFTRPLQKAYVQALERSLLDRAVQLDVNTSVDRTTHDTMLQTFSSLDLSSLTGFQTKSVSAKKPAGNPIDPMRKLVQDLESRDAFRVRRVLKGPLPSQVIPRVISLLAWDEVAKQATLALRDTPTSIPALSESLKDPSVDFAVRRRIPRILATHSGREVVPALLKGLVDSRFEVRFRSGLALSRLKQKNPKIRFVADQIFPIVLREVAVNRRVWESQQLLDELEEEEVSPVVEQFLRDRTNSNIQHVFTLLSLVFAKRPLKLAFLGLHTQDAMLKGTALEYLETVLPEEIREKLWPFLEVELKKQKPTRSQQEIVEDLLNSHQSIAVNLEELLKGSGED